MRTGDSSPPREVRLVYLLGRRAKGLEAHARELAARGLAAQAADWGEVPPGADGLAVALAPPPGPEALRGLPAGLWLVTMLDGPDAAALREAGALALPAGTTPAALAGLCAWLLPAARRARLSFLDRLLASTPTVVLTLDGSGAVSGLFPSGAVFLGRPAAEHLGRSAEEVLGTSLGQNGPPAAGRVRTLTDAEGREVPVIFSEVAGPPESPGPTALVLTVVEELGGLRRKAERLVGIQQNFTQQRHAELEAANELFQKQALELTRVLGELENRNQKIVEELELAGELQKSLLPREFPRDVALDFGHKYLPASFVSGDFFDVIPLGKGRAGIIVADVSGHGVAPAFLTTMFKGIFKANAAECDSPAVVMTRVNKEMCGTLRSEHYLTAFYAIIDTERMECRYSNAGHPKQLLFRADGAVEELTSDGFFIGMFEGTEYGEAVASLGPGDRLLLYTDGVIEVADASGAQFGREGIIRVAAANPAAGPEELSSALFQELLGHLGEEAFPDDVTILVAQLLGSI